MDEETINTVWQAVTADPDASWAQLATRTGLPIGTVYRALGRLVKRGHIGERPDAVSPRPIHRPFEGNREAAT